MSIFLVLVLCSYLEIYFLRISATLQRIDDLRISKDWKRKRAGREKGREEKEREKGKGEHFTVNLYFSKIYRTPSQSRYRDSICQSPSPDSETE